MKIWKWILKVFFLHSHCASFNFDDVKNCTISNEIILCIEWNQDINWRFENDSIDWKPQHFLYSLVLNGMLGLSIPPEPAKNENKKGKCENICPCLTVTLSRFNVTTLVRQYFVFSFFAQHAHAMLWSAIKFYPSIPVKFGPTFWKVWKTIVTGACFSFLYFSSKNGNQNPFQITLKRSREFVLFSLLPFSIWLIHLQFVESHGHKSFFHL